MYANKHQNNENYKHTIPSELSTKQRSSLKSFESNFYLTFMKRYILRLGLFNFITKMKLKQHYIL